MKQKHFTFECKKIANLAKKESSEQIANRVGKRASTIRRMVNVGLLPEDILAILRENPFWTFAKTRDIITLRSEPDHTELEKVITLAKSGKILTQKKLRQYVRRRKIEVEIEAKFKQKFEKEKQILEMQHIQELEKTRISTEKRIGVDIQHFARMCHDFDGVLSSVVYSQIEQMTKSQITTITKHTAWLMNELQKLSSIMLDYQTDDPGTKLRIVKS